MLSTILFLAATSSATNWNFRHLTPSPVEDGFDLEELLKDSIPTAEPTLEGKFDLEEFLKDSIPTAEPTLEGKFLAAQDGAEADEEFLLGLAELEAELKATTTTAAPTKSKTAAPTKPKTAWPTVHHPPPTREPTDEGGNPTPTEEPTDPNMVDAKADDANTPAPSPEPNAPAPSPEPNAEPAATREPAATHEPTSDPTAEAEFASLDEVMFGEEETEADAFLEESPASPEEAAFLRDVELGKTRTPTREPTSFYRGSRIPACAPQTRTGYLKNTAGKYLTCTNEQCEWKSFSSTAMQMFRQMPAHPRKNEEWSMFKVYTPSGAPTGQCLNQYKGKAGQHKLRVASCDIWTSRRWMLCSGFLHFGGWQCVQSNAGVAKCRISHQKITMESPKCKIAYATIDTLTCMSPVTGGGCAATGFDNGSMRGATSQSDCNACNAALGSTEQCSFSFAYTTESTVTQSWSDSFSWGMGVSFSLTESFSYFGAGGSATEGMSFHFDQTMTSGKAKSISTTVQDTAGCAVTLDPGTRESATATYLVGTIHADFKATVTRHWECNTGLNKTKSYDSKVTLTIKNVPTQKIVGSCRTQRKRCPHETNFPTPDPTMPVPTPKPTVASFVPMGPNGPITPEPATSHSSAAPMGPITPKPPTSSKTAAERREGAQQQSDHKKFIGAQQQGAHNKFIDAQQQGAHNKFIGGYEEKLHNEFIERYEEKPSTSLADRLAKIE